MTSQEYLKAQHKIEYCAHLDFDRASAIFRILSHRKKYAKYYLENSNADMEATISAIDKCNELIKQTLGL